MYISNNATEYKQYMEMIVWILLESVPPSRSDTMFYSTEWVRFTVKIQNKQSCFLSMWKVATKLLFDITCLITFQFFKEWILFVIMLSDKIDRIRFTTCTRCFLFLKHTVISVWATIAECMSFGINHKPVYKTQI